MTDTSEKAQFNVRLGTWTNWSRGHILGATLTLEPRYGLLILSFTATFVGFVASRFWRVVTLILHRLYSTPEPRDALHHQRQVVLRNSLSAASTLWTSLQLLWSWRAIANGYLARTLPIIIFAVCGFSAFTIAGGFTSSISSGIGNEVLIDGSHCGAIGSGLETAETASVIYPWVSQSMNNVANYAQQCYSFNTTGTLDCTTFVKRHLQFSAVQNASCPFSDDICRSNDSNILLDSGLISSDDLGLNMPSSQRMFYREVLHCAPIGTDGFVGNMNTEYNNLTTYWYGSTEPGGVHTNWTYPVESLKAQYRRLADSAMLPNNQGFNLIDFVSTVSNGTFFPEGSEFKPIPQLTLSDADLELIFLSPTGVVFMEETKDPWYRGIIPYRMLYFGGGQRMTYIPEEAASPMGCAHRWQYCNSNKECGSLASLRDAIATFSALNDKAFSDVWDGVYSNSDAETSRLVMFIRTTNSGSRLADLINTLGPYALLGREHFAAGLMGPIPDNQWQLDVTHWFSMRMAAQQALFVEAARGAPNEALLPFFQSPSDENKYQWEMCNNQKILSSDYISLSLFGLYFTYKEYKYLEWAANSTLQLQRLAYQGLGSEKWTNYTDDIPKTRPGYFLADLARAYPPEEDGNECQEVKPATRTASTTTPSVSEVSTNQCVPGQPQGAPFPQHTTAPEPPTPQPIPQVWKPFPPVPGPMFPSPQAMTPSLQAVLPNPQAVSPTSQNVSPISQPGGV